MRASILGENNPVLPILALSSSISVKLVHAPDTTKLTMHRNSRHMFQQLKYLTLWRFSPRFTYLVSVFKKIPQQSFLGLQLLMLRMAH